MSTEDNEKPKQNLIEKVEKVEDDSFNGADCGQYRWSQSETEIDLTVPVKVKKGKEVKVEVRRKDIKVKVLNEIVVEGQLEREVKSDETVWNLVPGKNLRSNSNCN